jgi:hypothetical protein
MPFHGSGTDVQFRADITDAERLQVEEVTYDPGCRRKGVQEEVDILPFEGEERIGAAAEPDRFREVAGIGGRGGLAFIDGGMQDNGIDLIEEGSFFGVVSCDVPEHLQHPVVESFEGLVVVGEEAFA